MDERISAHLKPAQPIELEYTIDTSGESPTHPECYEIDVEIPINVPGRMADFLEALNKVGPSLSVLGVDADTPSTPGAVVGKLDAVPQLWSALSELNGRIALDFSSVNESITLQRTGQGC